jgi:hypothetical protein
MIATTTVWCDLIFFLVYIEERELMWQVFAQISLKLQQIRQKNVILQQYESEEYCLIANMLTTQIINNGK